MNPIVAEILAKNASDIEVIVNKIGLPTLLALVPNLMNILATVQAASAKPR